MWNKRILSISLFEMLWFFIIYSFLGWLVEEAYIFIAYGVLVKRGFLYGPIGPIYGFGMLIVILSLTPVKKRLIPLFVGAILLTSTLEYTTGYILENIFNERWWDYTGFPYNLNGYICLKFSIAWGFICVFIIRIIHPRIQSFVSKTLYNRSRRILIFLYCIILVDFVATLASLMLQRS